MDANSDASMVTFDFFGKLEVSVRKNNGEKMKDIKAFKTNEFIRDIVVK